MLIKQIEEGLEEKEKAEETEDEDEERRPTQIKDVIYTLSFLFIFLIKFLTWIS